VNIGKYTLEEYKQIAKSFHGSLAPGLLIGGFMVDRALRELPQTEGVLYDTICETSYCLPDAIQLLTPGTLGNGWLKLVDTGRYALSMFDKSNGRGVRVFIDAAKLEPSSEIKAWFLKLKPKKQQNTRLLIDQILAAGDTICGVQPIVIDPTILTKRHKGAIALCPVCGEAFPEEHGVVCRACDGEPLYRSGDRPATASDELPSFLAKLPVEEAAGEVVLHDMTMIEPGVSKGPAFKRGQVVAAGDLCRLQTMGRYHLYRADGERETGEWVHEDEAALSFARAMAGANVAFTDVPKEGRCDLRATADGVLIFDDRRLEAFNLAPGVMCASRRAFALVRRGEVVAGTRAIPLYLRQDGFQRALALLGPEPLFRVAPIPPAKVGVLVTGTEVFQGLVEERFFQIVKRKAAVFGCEVLDPILAPDDRQAIQQGVEQLLAQNIDLLVTTAGLSVDPDDVTRQALIDAGAVDLVYGIPVLPGGMLLVGRIGQARLIGVPACALHYNRTSFDLILPRVLAGCEVTRRDVAKMGSGGMCLQCATCVYPRCVWGG